MVERTEAQNRAFALYVLSGMAGQLKALAHVWPKSRRVLKPLREAILAAIIEVRSLGEKK